MTTQPWTKALVQSHAQAAVAVELYTLPFYLTVLSSLQDTSGPIYANILSVCMEEMLHLELAANLCLAVGTRPNFTVPLYGQPIPLLKPDDPETGHYALINAQLGALDQTTLNTMLDIETPEEFEAKTHTTPDYPYESIGEMYDALLEGIADLGWYQLYVGNITNQQAFFGATTFAEQLSTFTQVLAAITTINEQGEGQTMPLGLTPPYTMADFPIPPSNQLPTALERLDPTPLNTYAHYGRFVGIQNYVKVHGFPAVYTGVDPNGTLNPTQRSALTTLQTDFADLITMLNSMWAGGSSSNFFPVMQGDGATGFKGVLADAVACWQAGVIPMWSAAQSQVTPKPLRVRAAG